MLDPIGCFQRIRDQYIAYLETAFRIADPEVSRQRRELLETAGQLCTEPLVEPVPRYRSVHWQIRDIALQGTSVGGLEGDALKLFGELIQAGLFPGGDLSLYEHQLSMLKRGLRPGEPGIVTSGTGSGKTESFLLPIIGQICREAVAWETPDSGYMSRRWWHDEDGVAFSKFTQIPRNRRPLKANPSATPFELHRTGERRPAAMRCLILYPMNALVEDQLARIREALDSDRARAVLNQHLDGNRIFFGRYTGETPVTGFDVHPRRDPSEDVTQRGRRLAQLFDRVGEMERTQDWIRGRIRDEEFNAQTRFLFPSTDGSELTTRWDIQETPPDILISNISMLGAMLNREVDSPIFDTTRDWLLSNEDACFHLVLDELHLHRGTSGTEVAYLVRLLLHRLGLTDPAHRHKLRILASSASLPTGGEPGEMSQAFLWDMFGSHGTSAAENSDGADGPAAWDGTIVPGKEILEGVPTTLAPSVFSEFLERLGGSASTAVDEVELPAQVDLKKHLAPVAEALEVGTEDSDGQMAGCVRAAADVISAATWSEDDGRHRATSLGDLAERIFQNRAAQSAVRGLLLVRGLADAYPELLRPEASATNVPSFRVHTFFRALEGLYAPFEDLGGRIGNLSIERAIASSGPRSFDLLYCESCGDLLVGGRRFKSPGNTKLVEITPMESDLESLPDKSNSGRFEDQSFDSYVVFWPQGEQSQPAADHEVEKWRAFTLDARTGQCRKGHDDSGVKGWLFNRGNGQDRHRRLNSDAGTHVPYACPTCETSYRPRVGADHRLSPVRNFRPGFAKTTQLLSSELFEILHLGSTKPKLVSFSDSRQEAAKAALDIEGRHHQDLARQLLITELKKVAETRLSPAELNTRKKEILAAVRDLSTPDELVVGLRSELSAVEAAISMEPGLVGPISQLVSDPLENDHRGSRSGRPPLSALIAEYVRLGVHPTDPSGVGRVKTVERGNDVYLEWTALVEQLETGDWDWADSPRSMDVLNAARERLLSEALPVVTEVLFSKTYFALEETGIGYPSLPRLQGESDADLSRANAAVRLLADSYRFKDSPFVSKSDIAGWSDASATKRSRVITWFKDVFGDVDGVEELDRYLKRLTAAGHDQGLIQTAKMFVRLVDEGSPAWRCTKCTRIHLHRGFGRCTRCSTPLVDTPNDTAGAVAERNHLGRKIVRQAAPFRLHCEELTGQTDDGPERQRAFRDVLIPSLFPEKDDDGEYRRDPDGEVKYQDAETFLEQREAIDLLTVTTTMEVGIDIGSLQAVVQANMPPQRFNYQQRVGRAGRRGQAFSMALTVCRTKSHDLHYFRWPAQMTGDVPPPPFLARSRPEIARRFLRKFWLNTAFGHLREGSNDWPADGMRPPDIHGEFLPTGLYETDAEWRVSIAEALAETLPEAQRFLETICDHEQSRRDEVWLESDELAGELDSVAARDDVKKEGLAHTLAEAGMLPMYGMPTRVRDLYTGTRWTPEGTRWRSIDRDSDLAIQEFAPGSTVIKDKRTHRAIGFTGALPNPLPGRAVDPFGSAFGPRFWLAECTRCRAWNRSDEEPVHTLDCSCGAPIAQWSLSLEPLGYRTDFSPRIGQVDDQAAPRSRSVQAEHHDATQVPIAGTNMLVSKKNGARTYRLNKGHRTEDGWSGYSATSYTNDARPGSSSVELHDQWIDIATIGKVDAPEFTNAGARVERVWLASPKTTDIVSIAPASIQRGISLRRLAASRPIVDLGDYELLGALQATAVRAAAMSATYLFAYRAAKHLDVDPEEFDIIEPRLVGTDLQPALQLADFLVNGAGLCSTLGQADGGSTVASDLITSIVIDRDLYPLEDLLDAGHVESCGRACYRCILRHSNQSYHGLLDWRLGMAYLDVLANPGFDCGLTSAPTAPSTEDWPRIAASAVERFEARDIRAESESFAGLPAIRVGNRSPWCIVVHPLWDIDDPQGILKSALEEAPARTGTVDSFTLDRRPWEVRRAYGSMTATTGVPPIVIPESERVSQLGGERDYELPGTMLRVDLAWPDLTGQKACFVSNLSRDTEIVLLHDNWAIFVPGQEKDLILHIDRYG